MHPIQPPNYPATSSDTAATAVVEEKPSKVNYTPEEMRGAVSFGRQRREARRISLRSKLLNEGLARGEEKQSANEVARVFKRSKEGKLNPCKESHPARRGSDNPALRAIRQIKADEFLARKMAEGEQTTGWGGDDIASHQGVLDRRGASSAVESDRTCGAIVQQPSGNSSPVRQHFFAADFYTLLSELGTNEAEQLFHKQTDDQKDQFRDYCLTHVNLSENEVLMGLLFP